MSDGDTSWPVLLSRLRDDSVALVKAELALARAEWVGRWHVLRGAIVPAVLAIAVLHAGVLALGAATVMWLGAALGGRYVLSSAAVGLAFLSIAGAAMRLVFHKVRAATKDTRALTVPGQFAVEVLNERSKRE